MQFLKYTLTTVLIIFFGNIMTAQDDTPNFKLSLQTDLIAYTTSGGWSAWLAMQHHQNKLSLAMVNFPDRYADYSEETGLIENDRFFRIQLARYFNPESKMKNFYVGANFEYHLRELEEETTNEILDETGFKIAPIIGYEWHPWNKKENALQNFSLAIWGGPTFLLGYDEDLTFDQTGSIYEARESVEVSLGVMISYTIFKK